MNPAVFKKFNYRSLLLICILCLSHIVAHAQSVKLAGNIRDAEKKTVPYANIGVVNTSIGTSSDEYGNFEILIPSGFKSRSLTFSAIGYTTVHIPINSFEYPEDIEIELEKIFTELDEVKVSGEKTRNKKYRLGNKFVQGGVNLCSDPEFTNGASVALLVSGSKQGGKNFEYPVFLSKAKLKVEENTLDNFKVRLRVYGRSPKTGMPSEQLLHESIIVESKILSGWIEFDLRPYSVLVEDDFFIAFEWILDKRTRLHISKQYKKFELLNPDRNKITASMLGGKSVAVKIYDDFNVGTSFGVCMTNKVLDQHQTYLRYNSLGKWERAGFILTAEVILSNQNK